MRKPDLAARLAKLPGDFRIVPPTLKCPRCGADAGFDLRQVVRVYYAIEGEATDCQSERTLLVNSDVFAFDSFLPLQISDCSAATAAKSFRLNCPSASCEVQRGGTSERRIMDTVLKLRELRRLRGLSQKDVARLSGIGEKTISSFETGERIDSLKVSHLSTLLKVYGITAEEFFGRKLEEQFDPDSIQQRSVEEDVIARLRALPRAPRGTLLEKFVLMLDATDAMLPSARQRPMLVRPAA